MVDATEMIQRLRRIKSSLEIAAHIKAAEIADIGMMAARGAIAPGVTELEVFGEMIHAMTKAGGEFPGILPPVMSGFRSNCLHPIASRKVIQAGDRVNVDLCGVYKRYHSNLARSFWVGDPPEQAATLHKKSIGVYSLIEQLVRPGINVREFLMAIADYYEDQGILEDAYWSGGYELGIAFPPDWVGSFIYDLSITEEDEVFDPMTVINHECNFFAPDGLGISATIETIIFQEQDAVLASKIPRDIQVIPA